MAPDKYLRGGKSLLSNCKLGAFYHNKQLIVCPEMLNGTRCVSYT
jgi:hypothetical protein